MLVCESVCWSDPSHVRQETRISRADDVSDGDDGKMVDGHITSLKQDRLHREASRTRVRYGRAISF